MQSSTTVPRLARSKIWFPPWRIQAAGESLCGSPYHLVSQRKQRRRHIEAERFGGLEVEHEFRTLSAPAPAAPTPYSLRSSWLAVISLYILGISRSAASVVTDSMSRCKSAGNSDDTVGAGFFPSPHCRPCREHRHEIATPHSITSSAMASILSGIWSPSAWAVLRLTTKSNLIGCSIGKSPGFAPFRILST
jgi:hypothetical protein